MAAMIGGKGAKEEAGGSYLLPPVRASRPRIQRARFVIGKVKAWRRSQPRSRGEAQQTAGSEKDMSKTQKQYARCCSYPRRRDLRLHKKCVCAAHVYPYTRECNLEVITRKPAAATAPRVLHVRKPPAHLTSPLPPSTISRLGPPSLPGM